MVGSRYLTLSFLPVSRGCQRADTDFELSVEEKRNKGWLMLCLDISSERKIPFFV